MDNTRDPSLRLRPWASLVLFLSAYSPLMLILIIKDYDATSPGLLPQNPVFSGILLLIAVFSSLAVLRSVREIDGGLTVTVTKASNKSGDMFGYTIPYMLSFMKVDLGDWQVIVSLALFLAILFIMAYRTQTVFVNRHTGLAFLQHRNDLAFRKPTFLQGSLRLVEAPKFYWLMSTRRGSLRLHISYSRWQSPNRGT